MPLSSFSMGELFVIFAILLLVFGSKRMPEIGASIGRGLRGFKRGMSEATEALRFDHATRPPPTAGPARSPPPPPSPLGGDQEPKRLSE